MLHILETIVSKGDVHESENTNQSDVDLAAQEISQLLRPLAILVSRRPEELKDDRATRLQREVWFNTAVHGITPGTTLWKTNLEDLQKIAIHSNPLVSEDRVDQFEGDIELNSVLRRGMNGPHATEMKKRLAKILPRQEAQIRGLTYPKVMFLHSTYLLETLRAEAGHCAEVLSYFIDPSVHEDDMGVCMVAIADEIMKIYLKRVLSGLHADCSASYVAVQLAEMLTVCCHRIPKCQQAATSCCDKLISQMPSSLCQKSSLFALLELLTLVWSSCLEAEIDEYNWKSTYVSTLGNVTLELSDDFDFRRRTLNNFYKMARLWITKVINVAPLDLKGLLQVK